MDSMELTLIVSLKKSDINEMDNMTSFIDKKYINIFLRKVDRFKWKKNNLANCRCPICGDSKKNKTKREDSFQSRRKQLLLSCFNCGFGPICTTS